MSFSRWKTIAFSIGPGYPSGRGTLSAVVQSFAKETNATSATGCGTRPNDAALSVIGTGARATFVTLSSILLANTFEMGIRTVAR